jgi:hypothetical protein
MNGSKTRIATVTDETHPLFGQRFVVQQWRERVHCWGQVSSYTSKARRHESSLSIESGPVNVEDYAGSGYVLSCELFEQNVEDMRRRGAIITGRGRTLTIRRAPFSEAVAAVAAELNVNLKLASREEIAEIVALAEEL